MQGDTSDNQCSIEQPINLQNVKLTTMCTCAGCAAKIQQLDLERILAKLQAPEDSRVLAGQTSVDDAVVIKIHDDLALVQTVDFFTPVVDDPYHFGRIAAANSLSDVYAMGGNPLSCMNITCFPIKKVGTEVLSEILRGGLEKIVEAGAIMAGGHTVEDPQPKYGLAVTGTINPRRLVRKNAARPGDLLILTKPLGTGTLNTAHKRGDIKEDELENLIMSMETLNKKASQVMVKHGAQAATDITGYGLLGHLLEMCRTSSVSADIFSNDVPLLPGAEDSYKRGNVPGGSVANLNYVSPYLTVTGVVPPHLVGLLADAQTSGGLLIAATEEEAELILRDLTPLLSSPRIIGRLTEQSLRPSLLNVL